MGAKSQQGADLSTATGEQGQCLAPPAPIPDVGGTQGCSYPEMTPAQKFWGAEVLLQQRWCSGANPMSLHVNSSPQSEWKLPVLFSKWRKGGPKMPELFG